VKRYLIVNADDFGRSTGINRGVAECHERGIVTSTSLMVRWPAAEEASLYARAHPRLSVGLHVDLSEWAVRDGDWALLYERVAEEDPDTVAAEIDAQLAAFRELLGRDPTHLDGHQHVQRAEPAKSVLFPLAAELGVPLRDFSPRVRYLGSFYGQTRQGEPLPGAISVTGLLAILSELPPGITELGCHPAAAEDFESMYLGERLEELQTLCDPRIAAALAAAGIELLSFAEVA
jgi:chitin disaccharide deacetylase